MRGGIECVRQWFPWPWRRQRRPDPKDPKDQMEYIARVEFEPKRLLNKSEYSVLVILEDVTREINAGLRVMAQTSMGEIIRPKKGSASEDDCNLAFRSINSKRLDFVVINRFGTPVLAIEYQGAGHYHQRSFMRDAVKREALRKAGVPFLEVPSNYKAVHLEKRAQALLRAATGYDHEKPVAAEAYERPVTGREISPWTHSP
jgi:hypothetical protein